MPWSLLLPFNKTRMYRFHQHSITFLSCKVSLTNYVRKNLSFSFQAQLKVLVSFQLWVFLHHLHVVVFSRFKTSTCLQRHNLFFLDFSIENQKFQKKVRGQHFESKFSWVQPKFRQMWKALQEFSLIEIYSVIISDLQNCILNRFVVSYVPFCSEIPRE